MRMCDFVVRDAIIADLQATTKEDVIREIVDSLRASGQLKSGADTEDIVRAIQKRESLGSTGIGRGIAIPHTKHTGVDHLLGTVAISSRGVEFNSLDREPVFVFVLLISPQDRPGDHLRALENVSRTLKDDALVRALRAAGSRENIWALLDGSAGHHAG